MKKITYVIPVFPVVSETFITTEIKALTECGHDIQPVCFERNSDPCQVGDEAIAAAMVDIRNVKVLSLMSLITIVFINFFHSGWKALKFSFDQQGIRPRSLLLQACKLAYLTRKHGSDHIHAHFAQCSAATAIVAARLLGISVSFTSHGSDVYKAPCDLQLKLQNANFSIAVCKRMKKDFYELTPTPQVHIIPCGVDVSFFQARSSFKESSKNGVEEKSKKFIFLGRLAQTKGILHLILAVAKLPIELRPSIDIAGDGYLREEAVAMVNTHGVAGSFTFLGEVDKSWVQQNCSNYAAMISPFCKAGDGIMDTGPLVIKEALALKLPLLTTDIMATGEFVDSSCAFISNSSDPEDLARTLLKLLMSLNFISVNSDTVQSLQKILGPRVNELEHIIQHSNPIEIIEEKVEQGYSKVLNQLSSKKQGLALSKIFQNCQV
jgi:glycosyltransferase involved in cell wall biosynthesis